MTNPTAADLKVQDVFAVTSPRRGNPGMDSYYRPTGTKTETYRVISVKVDDKSRVFELATLDGKRVTRSFRGTSPVEIMTPDADELAILWR